MCMIYWCCSRGKVSPPCPKACASLSCLNLLCYSGAIYQVSSVRCLYMAEDCFHFKRLYRGVSRFMSPFFSFLYISQMTVSSDISRHRTVRRAQHSTASADSTAHPTQMTLGLLVPLETRCSEIRKDPFHTSAASEETKRLLDKGKVGGRAD